MIKLIQFNTSNKTWLLFLWIKDLSTPNTNFRPICPVFSTRFLGYDHRDMCRRHATSPGSRHLEQKKAPSCLQTNSERVLCQPSAGLHQPDTMVQNVGEPACLVHSWNKHRVWEFQIHWCSKGVGRASLFHWQGYEQINPKTRRDTVYDQTADTLFFAVPRSTL